MLAARHETSFPLASARSQGNLLEVGIEELRFEAEDAGVLLRNVGVAGITDEEIASLLEQTEGVAGWPLPGRTDEPRRSTDHGSVDPRGRPGYRRLPARGDAGGSPADEVDFLIRTSVLEELSGPLCDAALEFTGSGAILQSLEASNLLVVPLDHQRDRYRYHHLFRDTLRSELVSRSPELIGPITARASAWCEQEGSAELAISYAMAGRHVDRVADRRLDTPSRPTSGGARVRYAPGSSGSWPTPRSSGTPRPRYWAHGP